MRGPATAAAPGKINVAFQVGPLRENGYHDVASLYLALDLQEIVTAYPAEAGTAYAELSEASTIILEPDEVPTGEDNLAVKAARLLCEYTGHAGGVRLSIAKHVPVAGGMGGGSADAAAALVACDALWGLGLSRGELMRLGARLGADVPFALTGGAAVGLGVGDQLSPLLHVEPSHWVLIPASYGLSTPRVYSVLDELRASASRGEEEGIGIDPDLVTALRDGDPDTVAPHLRNDLQAAAVHLAPELEQVFEAAKHAGALASLVSGSGPTVAVLARDGREARRIATQLSDELEVRAIPAQGPAQGARLLR